MNRSEIQTAQTQSTSAYWGYRELNADEVMSVAGGYDGTGDGFDGGTGYGGNDTPGATTSAPDDTQVAGFWSGLCRGIQGYMNDWGIGTQSPSDYGYPGGLRG